jgi:hypothetical protein
MQTPDIPKYILERSKGHSEWGERDAFKRLLEKRGQKINGRNADIVSYAIHEMRKVQEVIQFFKGYVADIKAHPNQYSSSAKMNPEKYAKADIALAIKLSDTDAEVSGLWRKALRI